MKNRFTMANGGKKAEAGTLRDMSKSGGVGRNCGGDRANNIDSRIVCYTCKAPGHTSLDCLVAITLSFMS